MPTPPPLPPDAESQKAALDIMAVNLAIPGLGTIQAGRKIKGWFQLVLAVTGLMMSLYFGGWFLLEWKSSGVLPTTTMARVGQLPRAWWIPFFSGLGGIFVFMIALGWSFASSLRVRREQERR